MTGWANRLSIQQRDAGGAAVVLQRAKLIVRTLDANSNDIRAMIDTHGRITQLVGGGITLERYRCRRPGATRVWAPGEVSYGRQPKFIYN